ncbi:tape measure protein [Bacteroides sp. UBA939]|uniref:tape measure protein n=1 Tax=Bacteroides sp. UBA939 TaxID=1946092 RepID=UPI0025C506BD|nr:tape measure protein [Bacteroides sp. UBA939]
MAKLVFRVAADWEEVIRLRNEISKLKQELKGMDSSQSPATFKTLSNQLKASTQKMDDLVSKAAQAGAVMENDFRKGIYTASQSVNGFTEKIIAQKAVVKDVEADVRRLGESYRVSLRRNPMSSAGKLDEWVAAKKALDEEKATLFGLTQQQAEARLSVKKLRDEYALFKDESKDSKESIGDIAGEMKAWIAGIAGGIGVKEFISQMIKVRGEFQAADTAIQTLLGSKEKADALMEKVREYAKISPLEFSDVTQATQMMLGFNIEAEKVPRYLSAIGDVSMGDSQKFNSLTLAFSQMSSAGKLVGQDFNQMINAGFNPLQVISEKTGKSFATLKEEMSKGAISAEMVQQAFIDATNAGGKFYQMSENASKTINGQLSMMQDAMDAAFNELGEKSEGMIMSGIQVTTSLIQNYETIGKVLAGLIVTYGAYRAALILNITLTRGWAVAARADAVAKGIQTIATKAQTAAQLALNAAMKANPFVLLATVAIGAASAMWAMYDSTTAAEKATKKFNEEQERFNKTIDERKQKIDELIRIIQDETETVYAQIKAYKELQKLSPALTEAYSQQELATLATADSQKILNKETEQLNYEHTIEQIAKYKKLVENLSGVNDWNDVDLFTRKEHPTGSINDALKQDMDSLEKWQNALNEYNRLKKEAEENAKPVEVKLLEAQTDLNQIQKEFDRAKKKLDEEHAKLKDNPFYVIPFHIQIEVDNLDSKLKKAKDFIATLLGTKSESKAETKDYDYWDKQKKEADKALKDIDSTQKKLMDAGKFNGIDTSVVESYKKNSKLLKEAEKELGVYDSSSKQKNQAASETKKLRKQQEQIAEEHLSLRRKNQQDEINLMEEGSEKKLAQIELDYQKEIDAIKKLEEDWSKANGGKLTDKQSETISNAHNNAESERMKGIADIGKKEEEHLKELLEKYRDFDAQRTAIEEQGNADIAALQSKRTDANAKEIDRAIEVAKKKIKEGIQQVNDTQATEETKDNSFIKKLFGDVSEMAFDDLQELIVQAKQLREYLSDNGDSKGITFISPEQLKAIEKSPAELEKLKKALDGLLKGNKSNTWDDIMEGFTKGFAKLKSTKGFKEVSEGLQDIGQAASDASSMLSGVAGSLASMFEEMGDTGAADAMTGVQDAMNSISNIGQGFAKGGIVGGIAAAVGEAANFIGKAFAANARHKAALKEIMNETMAQQREYNLLLMQQNLEYEKATTIFGTDAYGKAANAVTVMKDAIADLNVELQGTSDQKKSQSKDALFRKFFGVVNPQEELKKAYAGLADIEIKTGHKKTGLFGWGKGKDIYSSILDVYPELIDANGKFDKSLAETILNTRTMSDESKAALQNMIDLAQQAEDAYNQLNDYLTDIFGDLGNTMSDALVDAFENGTDAAQAFTDSVSDMLETLAKQMIYSVTIAPLLEKAQKDMMDTMQDTGLTDDQKFSKWTGILNGLVDDAVEQQGVANRLYGDFQQMAKEKGIDIFQPDDSSSQNATKGGFQVMSQDTGSELNGRFAALQIAGEEIKNQAVKQVDLLSSINEKMSTLYTAPDVEDTGAVVSPTFYVDELREVFASGFTQRDIFSEQIVEQLVSMKGELSGLKGIVDDMRDLQANTNLNCQFMVDNTTVLAKNSRNMLADTNEIKRNSQKW